jgi:hypothetical protein
VLYVGTPIDLWMLLQRPSYINGLDRAAAVFSHEAANVMRQRLLQYDTVEDVNAGGDLKLADSMGLDELCARSMVRFYMTHQVLDVKPVDTLPSNVPMVVYGLKLHLPGLKLYECPERSGG